LVQYLVLHTRAEARYMLKTVQTTNIKGLLEIMFLSLYISKRQYRLQNDTFTTRNSIDIPEIYWKKAQLSGIQKITSKIMMEAKKRNNDV
jgi:hypothetical protein